MKIVTVTVAVTVTVTVAVTTTVTYQENMLTLAALKELHWESLSLTHSWHGYRMLTS
jgi:hypothetical protein